jgi:hypothetical protein
MNDSATTARVERKPDADTFGCFLSWAPIIVAPAPEPILEYRPVGSMNTKPISSNPQLPDRE